MMDEVAHEGNQELARFLGCSLKTACRYAKGMRRVGVVFKWRKTYIAANGKQRMTTVNKWFPSRVMAYMAAMQRQRDGR